MDGTSRVTGDSHARFCERLGVKFPGPTRRRRVTGVPTATNELRAKAADEPDQRGRSTATKSGVLLSLPSRPGEFHPEPLTDPDLNLSIHPARAID